MKNLIKAIVISTVFFTALIIAFYFEEDYRQCVRYFFKLFQGNHIEFFGKNLRLFVSEYFISAFGAFNILFSILLFKTTKKRVLPKLLLTISLFFLTTALTSYIDSCIKVIECTICKENKRELNYNGINYDYHFIASLIISLLPLTFGVFKNRMRKVSLGADIQHN